MKPDGLIPQMIEISTNATGERKIAVNAVRSLCKWYGGQMISMPHSTKTKTVQDLRGVLADEVGDIDADKIIADFVRFFGGYQLYIPLESRAFRDSIAREIYERYDGTSESMRGLCRKYNMSFMQVYRLYHKAAEERHVQWLDFL